MNSTVFILDFYIYELSLFGVMFHSVARKPEPRLQKFACKAKSSPTEFSFQTIPVIILLVSFAITLNHRRTFLLHINTLSCVKAEILPMLRSLHFSYVVQNVSGIEVFTYSIYEY